MGEEVPPFDLLSVKNFELEKVLSGENIKRILTIGMGGGCDVFAAYGLASHLAKTAREDQTILYANCVGPRSLEGHESVTEFLYRVPAEVKPLEPGTEAYGTTILEQSCPRGPEGSPFIFVVPASKGEVDQVTQQNEAALGPAIQSLNLDLVLAVDCGGDSITGGLDFAKGQSPEVGRDRQVLRCLRSSGVPFIHLVFGPGCDGESSEELFNRCCEQLNSTGEFRGSFSLEPLLGIMADCCKQLAPNRTPNLMNRAFSGELPCAAEAGERDIVAVERHGGRALVPRPWMYHGLAFVHAS